MSEFVNINGIEKPRPKHTPPPFYRAAWRWNDDYTAILVDLEQGRALLQDKLKLAGDKAQRLALDTLDPREQHALTRYAAKCHDRKLHKTIAGFTTSEALVDCRDPMEPLENYSTPEVLDRAIPINRQPSLAATRENLADLVTSGYLDAILAATVDEVAAEPLDVPEIGVVQGGNLTNLALLTHHRHPRFPVIWLDVQGQEIRINKITDLRKIVTVWENRKNEQESARNTIRVTLQTQAKVLAESRDNEELLEAVQVIEGVLSHPKESLASTAAKLFPPA